MRRITAVVHTHNDERRLGRCLEMLYACDAIVIMDGGSQDRTLDIARAYGAKIVRAQAKPGENLIHAFAEDWLLCLGPRESMTEALTATLYEWKSDLISIEGNAFALALREETRRGWISSVTPEPRLVRADWRNWSGALPTQMRVPALEGELLRFGFP